MKNILVIEDDLPVRAGIVAVLRRQGYGVVDTGLGAEGLALALTHRPDLILSDINLPGLSGLDLLKNVRSRPEIAAIPVILMTGEPHKADARVSMTAGADDYLPKPFGMDQMLETVRARLERQTNIQHALDVHNHAERISSSEKIRLQTSALDAAACGIAITNHQAEVLWVNPAFTKLTGYTSDDIVGRNCSVLKSGQHPREFYASLWATIAAGNVWRGELVNKRKDGVCYDEEMTITPIGGKNGKVKNFIAIKQDVTDRKHAEQALARERDLLQVLMDNLPDYIYFKDTESRFIRVNLAHAAHLGLPKPEIAIGKTDADFFPMRLARQKLVDERRLFATGEAIVGLVEKSDTEAGVGAKWVSSTKVPIRSPEGKITGLVGISRDITASKMAEEEAFESKRFLQSTLDALSSHVAILDETGSIVKVNEAWKRFAHENGLNGRCGVGENYLRVCHAAAGPGASEAEAAARGIADVMAGKCAEFHLEYPCHSPQAQRWFVVRATRFADGGPVRVVVAHENITERKLTEERLRQNEADLTEGQRVSKLGSWRFDVVANQLRWSEELYRIFGVEHGEMQNTYEDFLELVVPEDRPKVWQANADARDTGSSFEIEYRIRNKTGELKTIREIGHPKRDASGQITSLFGTAQDITERKRAEEELQRKTALLEAQMDSSIDGILVVDEQGCKRLQNRQLISLLKLPEEIADDPDDAKLLAWVAGRVEKPEPFLERIRFLYAHPDEVGRDEIVLKDGTILDRYTAPMRGQNGQCYGRFWTFRDITEGKHADLERQRMEVQLRQAQKLESIGQLAAGIAHEINTPTQYVGDNTRFAKDSFASILKILESHEQLLAAAKTGVISPELLARSEQILTAADLDYLRAQIPQALNETLEGVERVSKIVRAMKEFSHPGGKEKAPADLNKAIESTVTIARNEWKYVSDVKLELEPNLPFVPCFLGEFNQAVLNLIVNAAHAISDVAKKNPGTKGVITVQTRHDGDYVEVRVADTGTGIPESARPKIFEPFFTTKGVGKGTGQGLAMVYGSIVNHHAGTVRFETEVGKGTTFIIRLPLKPSKEK